MKILVRLTMVCIVSFFAITGLKAQSSVQQSIHEQANRMNAHNLKRIGTGVRLVDTSGKAVSLSRFRGKTCYIDFWFVGCAPCVVEIPFWNDMRTRFSRDTNIVFITICIPNNSNAADWKKYIKEKKFSGMHLFALDAHIGIGSVKKKSIERAMFISAYPTFILLNKQGAVIGHDITSPSDKMTTDYIIDYASRGVKPSKSFLSINDYLLKLNREPDKDFVQWIESFYKMPYKEAVQTFLLSND